MQSQLVYVTGKKPIQLFHVSKKGENIYLSADIVLDSDFPVGIALTSHSVKFEIMELGKSGVVYSIEDTDSEMTVTATSVVIIIPFSVTRDFLWNTANVKIVITDDPETYRYNVVEGTIQLNEESGV